MQREPIVIESIEYEHQPPANANANKDNGSVNNNNSAYKSRTKTDVLDQVFAECKQAQNISDLFASTSTVMHKLSVIDLYQSAQVLLLPARGEDRLPEHGVSLDALAQRPLSPSDAPLRCRLLVQLIEHKPLTLRAATTHTTGVGETSLVRAACYF